MISSAPQYTCTCMYVNTITVYFRTHCQASTPFQCGRHHYDVIIISLLLDSIHVLYTSIHTTALYVNFDFKGKQGNKPESPLFYFHRKKAARVGHAYTLHSSVLPDVIKTPIPYCLPL